MMTEKILSTKKNGMAVLLLTIGLYVLAVVGLVWSCVAGKNDGPVVPVFLLCVFWLCVGWIPFLGLKVLKPQEALVLTLFGKYIGTLKGDGFYFVNPFSTSVNPAAKTKLGQSGDVDREHAPKLLTLSTGEKQLELTSKKISLKAMTLSNARQKVNDVLGNPVEISVAVIWKVDDTAKAVFNVDNYKEYLSLQCDTAVRDIVKIYPYDMAPGIDTTGDGQADDGSLRGSTTVVAERIRQMIQEKVMEAGLEILEGPYALSFNEAGDLF